MAIQESVGIKSIEVGARILDALLNEPRVSITALSEYTRMTPSKVHRYLVSFTRTGLVKQDPETKLYELGNMAFQLGIAAISRSDELSRAMLLQRDIRDTVDETVVLSVWGTEGPTIINVAESTRRVTMTMRVGAQLPLLGSASGLVFAAYMPRVIIKPLIENYVTYLSDISDNAIEAKLAKIRSEGLAMATGHLQVGVRAYAAPLFNLQGSIFSVLAIVDQENSDRNDNLSEFLLEKVNKFNKWELFKSSDANHT